MTRKFFIYMVSLMIPYLGYGQREFQRTFGGVEKENSYQVVTSSGNGVFSIGSTESFGAGKSDIYLIKTDSTGNLAWAKTYGGNKNDFGTSMAKTKDKNYVLLGYTASFTTDFNDICLTKINEQGDEIWTQVYGLDKSEYSTSVQCTSDGGFIILGETITFIGDEKNSEILIIKTNSEGVTQWSKILGGKNTDYAYSIRELKEGGYIIGGETNSYGSGEWDFYLLRLNKDGEVIWSKTYGESKSDYGRYALQCPDGGFIIGGNTLNFESKDFDFLIIKTDAQGNVEWSKKYGGLGTDYLLAMEKVDEKGFVFTGYSNSAESESEDAFLVSMDFQKGKAAWTRLYGSPLHDYGVSLYVDKDKDIIIGGSTNGFGTSGEDVYIIRTLYNPHLLTDCNLNYYYPFYANEVKVKVGTGHYTYELFCDNKKVDFRIGTTVSTVQMVCVPEE